MLIFALSCMIHHRPLVFTVVFVLEKCIFCFSQQQQHISGGEYRAPQKSTEQNQIVTLASGVALDEPLENGGPQRLSLT